MIYFKSLCILEMWAGISIPVHIFESRTEIVYRELHKKKWPEGTSNLSTAVRGSALKNLSTACVQSRTGTAGKRWKKESPKRGSYDTRPPELCSEFSVPSWYGFMWRMLSCSKTLPRRMQTVPFEKTSVILYGPVVGLSNFRWMSVLIINIFCPTR